MIGSLARAAMAVRSGDPDAVQHGAQLGGLVSLPGGDHDAQRPPVPVGSEVDLGGQPTAGAPQALVVDRVEAGSAGWSGPGTVPLFAFWPGGVLVSTHDRGVDADHPVDLADRVGLGLCMGQEPIPGAGSQVPSVVQRRNRS